MRKLLSMPIVLFVGTAGYPPANFPRMTPADIARFWKDVEFVNWLHINDFAAWEDGDVPQNVGTAAFLSDALKYHDGSEKAVWRLWLSLKRLPKQ